MSQRCRGGVGICVREHAGRTNMQSVEGREEERNVSVDQLGFAEMQNN